MPDQIIEVNPHFEEQMTDQLNKLPLLKLEYKFLDAYLINTYKELNTWFQIRENALTAWGYILFWMSYRKIYLNEFSANDLDWNLNIEGTLNYVMGISKQGWFNARNRIVENILPAVLQENGVIYFEVTDNEDFALINVLLGNEQGEPHSRVMKMVSICQRLFPEKKKYHVKISGYQLLEGIEVLDTQKNISQEHLPYVWITQLNFSCIHAFCENGENILMDAKLKKQQGKQSRIAYYSLVQALMKLEVFQKRFDDYFKEFGNYQKNGLETELLEKATATFTIAFFNRFVREKIN